ncbi:G-type lectin S-receptor-like serine/threonine-protein kinase At4g27290 [Cornus florida]|uniref:G-type lectin S-receptor-like serine/threonine-protein kinase At4g27290 n=1 Tax=Cornus florida TaxID=4283 RepID=UPI00289877AC|nr:G-type lectin S-receptor-like serine/threonine-protein kinase At4g27290 [Cornus florida]
MTGIPQFVLRKGSSEKTFRTGPRNGVRFSGIGWGSTTVFKHSFIFNADEVYYIDESSHISRLKLNQTELTIGQYVSAWRGSFQNHSGCVRRTSLDCHNEDGFVKLKNVKLPDLLEFWLKETLNLKECKAECLKNCSCTAYANSDIRGGGSGCLMWFDNLVDIRDFDFKESKQDMYIRMPASELSKHTCCDTI